MGADDKKDELAIHKRTKQEEWEALLDSRPRLIIEVGSSGGGVGVLNIPTANRFLSGDLQDCRYLCIDPDIAVRANNFRPYSFGWNTSITNPEVTQKYRGKAKSVWLKNTGSVVSKDTWYRSIYDLLEPGGDVVIFDNYTHGLYDEEHDSFEQVLGGIGFNVTDLSMNYRTHDIAQHPVVVQGLKMSGFQPTILVLKKPLE